MRRRSTAAVTTVAAVLAVGGVSACGDGTSGQGDEVERRDSAGVEIVTSLAEDQPLTAVFTPEFTLGGKETDQESFYQIHRSLVGTDSLGHIYVLDRQSYRVVAFDDTGSFLWSAGGQGEGPGELSFPGGMAVSPGGESVVMDLSKVALQRFAGGEFVGEWPLPFRVTGGEVMWDGDGLVLLRSELQAEGQQRSLFRISESGDSVRLFSVQGSPGRAVEFKSCGISINGMPPIFEPGTPWVAGGGALYVAPDARYAIRVYRDGGVVRRIERGLEPRPATAELALASVGEGMQIGTPGGMRTCEPDEVVEQRGFAPVMPWLGTLAVAPDGTLWVRRFVAAQGEDGPIDLFDASGAYVGTLPADSPFPVGFMPDGRILVRQVDEATEVERLAVGRVEIQGAER